jgi:hypothetical protein
MDGSEVAAWASAAAAIASAIAATLSFRSERKAALMQGLLSKESIKAAAFKERFAVYVDVQEFMRPWMRDGRPDISQLPLIVGAWDRSRFLFEPEVTAFIRQIWLDAVKAEYQSKIVSNEYPGDRDAAIKFVHGCMNRYFGGNGNDPYRDPFYQAFARDLSIPPPMAPITPAPE